MEIRDVTIDDFHLNKEGHLCARCGKKARGFAMIGGRRYCHPSDPHFPDCFKLQMRENSAVLRGASPGQ